MKLAALLLLSAQIMPHQHPSALPAPTDLWYSCCQDYDCREAAIVARPVDATYWEVAIADYPPILVKSEKVHPSQNGKSYFCTAGGKLPPTGENILCVFYVSSMM